MCGKPREKRIFQQRRLAAEEFPLNVQHFQPHAVTGNSRVLLAAFCFTPGAGKKF